jgi:hypothetical protein
MKATNQTNPKRRPMIFKQIDITDEDITGNTASKYETTKKAKYVLSEARVMMDDMRGKKRTL